MDGIRRIVRSILPIAAGWALVATAVLSADTPPPAPGGAPGQPPAGTPGAPAAPGAAKPGLPARQPAADRVLKNIWWNNKIGDDLKLAADQKSKLDGLLSAFLDETRKRQESIASAHESVRAALMKGDWKAARDAGSKQSDGATAILRSQVELQIQVLSSMTADQRKQMVEVHPNLIATPWIRMAGGAGPRGGRMAPDGAPPANP